MSAEPATPVIVQPAACVRGRLRVPGDKSISHRYALLAALAEGRSWIANFAPGADCGATLACLTALGVKVDRQSSNEPTIQIEGRGLRGLSAPDAWLDAQNSGTTLRLLAGVLAAHPFESTLTGDMSLLRRPMRRVIAPLQRMGATIRSVDNCAPLTVFGADLRGIDHTPEVPSAQVKSAVLLAGLQAAGCTSVREPAATRDHTELALGAFGVTVERSGLAVRITGQQKLSADGFRVPGDISSAAFWAVAAAALPGSDIELIDVGLNPTRTAFLDVLRRAGAQVEVSVEEVRAGEPRGFVRVRHGELRPLILAPEEMPALIDELPALAALAAHGGDVRVSGAAELRSKESDRIGGLVKGLRCFGVEAEEIDDGFHVRGGRSAPNAVVADAHDDHRLAMTFAVAALGSSRPCAIRGAEAVQVSYPGFFEVLESLRA